MPRATALLHAFVATLLSVVAVSDALAAPQAEQPTPPPAQPGSPRPLPDADPSLPAAATLLDEAVAALGGAEKLASIESYRVEAEAVQHAPAMLGVPERDYKATGELLWRRDGYARLRGASEQYDPSTRSVWTRKIEMGMHPGLSWSRVPDREREIFGRMPFATDGTYPFDPLRILYRGIARHAEALPDARTVKREQVGGTPCLKIMARVRYAPDETPRVASIWLDASSKRPVRCVVGALRTVYADWREVDGIYAPFKFTPGLLCGDQGNGINSLAEVKVLSFNSVTAEQVAAPTNLRDMAEVVAEEMARQQQP